MPVSEFLVYDDLVYSISPSEPSYQGESQLKSTQERLGVKASRHIEKSGFRKLQSPLINSVVALAIETAQAGYGSLVFCGGRQICQQTAALVSEAMPMDSSNSDVLNRRKDVINELRSLSVGADEVLERTMLLGVAFHRMLQLALNTI